MSQNKVRSSLARTKSRKLADAIVRIDSNAPVQRQKAVSAYFTSKQISAFAEQNGCRLKSNENVSGADRR